MHSPKISILILIALLGLPIHAAAEPTPARASQVATAPTATAADTELALELKVLEKSLEMERKLLEAHKEAVAGQQKSVDWWIAFISFAMAVVALLGGVIPYFFYRRESESLKEKQNELAELQQKADKQLEQAKELCEQAEKHSKEAEHHLSEIINIRQTAEQHTDDIEKMKNVTLGNLSTESGADNKAGIQAANELKENREIPLIEQLRAKALVLSHTAEIQANTAAYEKALTAWKSVLLEDEEDAQANFSTAFCNHMLAHLSEGTKKAQYLAEAGKQYARTLATDSQHYAAASNWGTVLDEEAKALAHSGRLNDALEKWQQAEERFQLALNIKNDDYNSINNWGSALNQEAKTLANAGRLNNALEKWKLAGERYQQALNIKPEFYGAANNWGIALSEEAKALASADRLNDALEKWKLAGKLYQQALVIKQDFPEAANNWGIALNQEAQALAQTGNEQKAHNKRQQALELLSNFIQKHPERTAELSYNLACVHALNNQTEQTIQALETCRQSGCLPDKAHIETDKDLDPIRNSEAFQTWFQQAFPENTPN